MKGFICAKLRVKPIFLIDTVSFLTLDQCDFNFKDFHLFHTHFTGEKKNQPI